MDHEHCAEAMQKEFDSAPPSVNGGLDTPDNHLDQPVGDENIDPAI
ncbi:hypothetical protein AB0D66_09085 [Streptomyces sp. NPDC048270]